MIFACWWSVVVFLCELVCSAQAQCKEQPLAKRGDSVRSLMVLSHLARILEPIASAVHEQRGLEDEAAPQDEALQHRELRDHLVQKVLEVTSRLLSDGNRKR
jgi:hypothetical protein